MKAYLIDPEARSVSEVEHTGEIENIYQLTDCRTFDAARFGEHGDAVFVDDEGLFKEPVFFFQIADNPNTLAGKGLVLGCDARGNSIAPKATLEQVRSTLRFFVKTKIGMLTWGHGGAANRVDFVHVPEEVGDYYALHFDGKETDYVVQAAINGTFAVFREVFGGSTAGLSMHRRLDHAKAAALAAWWREQTGASRAAH